MEILECHGFDCFGSQGILQNGGFYLFQCGFDSKIWILQIHGRNRCQIVAFVCEDGSILSENGILVLVIPAWCEVFPIVRYAASEKIKYKYSEREYRECCRNYHTLFAIFFFFLLIEISFESEDSIAYHHDHEEIDEYSVPDDSEGRYPKKESVYSEKHGYIECITSFFIVFVEESVGCEEYDSNQGKEYCISHRKSDACEKIFCHPDIYAFRKSEEARKKNTYPYECCPSGSVSLSCFKKEETDWYECEKNIGDVGKFSRLIALEGNVCWEFDIVGKSCFLSKITAEIFVERLSVFRDCLSFIAFFSFREFFGSVDFRIIGNKISTASSEKSLNVLGLQEIGFRTVFYEPWRERQCDSHEEYETCRDIWKDLIFVSVECKGKKY